MNVWTVTFKEILFRPYGNYKTLTFSNKEEAEKCINFLGQFPTICIEEFKEVHVLDKFNKEMFKIIE